MKKYLYFAGAALLGLASCTSEEPMQTGDGNVNLTIQLPGAVGTRALTDGDGKAAKNLHVAIFDQNGKFLSAPEVKGFDNGSLSTTVSLDLAKGVTYQIAFFACDDATGVYEFDAENGAVNVKYDKVVNTENQIAADHDCFFKTQSFEVSDKAINETVTLERPVAQLNWGTDDAETEVVKAVYANGVYANLTATVCNKLDLYSGDASGETPLTITPAVLSGDFGKMTIVEGEAKKEYDYVHTLYVLAPKGEYLVDTELTTGPSTTSQINTVTVSAVPIQRNYKTNIFGSLLTTKANITVTKEKNFTNLTDDKYNVDLNKGGQFVYTEAQDVLDLSETPKADRVITLKAPVQRVLLGSTDANSKATTTIVVGKDIPFPEFVLPAKGGAIRNLTIKGDLSSSERLEGFNTYGNGITIDGLAFENVPFDGKGVNVAFTTVQQNQYVQSTSNITVRNCNFTNLTEPAFNLQTHEKTGDKVENIVLENNHVQYADNAKSNTNGLRVLNTTGGTVTIKNNTIDGAPYHGIMLARNKATLNVEGNTLTNFKEDGVKIDEPYGTINILKNNVTPINDGSFCIRLARFRTANDTPTVTINGNTVLVKSMFTPAIALGFKSDKGAKANVFAKGNILKKSFNDAMLVEPFEVKTITPTEGSDYTNAFN